MVRVAKIVLRHRGGADTKEADNTSVKGADLKVTAAPTPTTTPGEPQITRETAAEDPVEVPIEIAPAAQAGDTLAEPETTKTKHSGRRGSADKAAKKEARQAGRAEKKEVRQDKRQAKKDARKEARTAAALEKKEKAEAASAGAADNSEGENSDPERASLLRRISQLLSWGGKGTEKEGEGEEEEEEEEEEKTEEDAEEAEEDTKTKVEEEEELTEETTQEAQPVEAHDELYVVNDIPIKMTVVEPQPIAA